MLTRVTTVQATAWWIATQTKTVRVINTKLRVVTDDMACNYSSAATDDDGSLRLMRTPVTTAMAIALSDDRPGRCL